MNDQSILSQLTDIEAQRADLLAAARSRRDDLLAELSGLCSPKLLGPLTRAEIPDGILKRRERKTAKPAKVKKARTEVAP